jgi:hypothetical protein
MVGSILILDKMAWVGTAESILASDPRVHWQDIGVTLAHAHNTEFR